MTVSEKCRNMHVQDCSHCEDVSCCDNTNPERFRPAIVCLCGSTKFKESYESANNLIKGAANVPLSLLKRLLP